MVNAWRQVLLVVSDKDEGLVPALAESLNDGFYPSAIIVVKPVERLVKDEQLGIFHECPGQEHQPLLST